MHLPSALQHAVQQGVVECAGPSVSKQPFCQLTARNSKRTRVLSSGFSDASPPSRTQGWSSALAAVSLSRGLRVSSPCTHAVSGLQGSPAGLERRTPEKLKAPALHAPSAVSMQLCSGSAGVRLCCCRCAPETQGWLGSGMHSDFHSLWRHLHSWLRTLSRSRAPSGPAPACYAC